MSQSLALVFPGQGSQQLGMLGDLAAEHSIIQETFAEA
jgi:[acyl-carrier-protein] S-malonyltransferase